MLFDFVKKKKNKFYLDEVIQGIGESVVKAKIGIDIVAIKARQSSHEHDEIMKMLPFITFKISDVEIDLKFMVTGLEDIQELDKSQDFQNSENTKGYISSDNYSNYDENNNKVQPLRKRVVVNMDIDELAKIDHGIICKITYKMTQNTISEYSVNDKNIILERSDEN